MLRFVQKLWSMVAVTYLVVDVKTLLGLSFLTKQKQVTNGIT